MKRNNNFHNKKSRPRPLLLNKELVRAADKNGVHLERIVTEFELKEGFSKKALTNAREVCNISKEDYAGREDFRQSLIFTIDGDDAKDFDDAVAITKTAKEYVLEVHIADVAHYVKKDSPLDKEAERRGTSVYFPFGVIPMLPKELSDGICSLKEGEDRLTLSVIMHIDKSGNVTKHRLCESVINSKARLTYKIAQKIIDGEFDGEIGRTAGGEADGKISGEVSEKVDGKINGKVDGKIIKIKEDCGKKISRSLTIMTELAQILMQKRRERGSIDFGSNEPEFVSQGEKIVEVKKGERLFSMRLIEEFMILANETVAAHFFNLKTPFIYRTHGSPTPEKMERFLDFLDARGIAFDYGENNDGEVVPADFLRLLESSDPALKGVLSSVILRAMVKAIYEPICRGHFGLNSEFYCHFTSPIRRYPDLFIHRVIKSVLKGENVNKYKAVLTAVSEESSLRERLAEEAERKVDDFVIANCFKKLIGQKFKGVVSGVCQWGVFVELESTAEGLIRLENLEGEYVYEPKSMTLTSGAAMYRLGQALDIVVAGVRGDKIEFYLDEFSAHSKPKSKPSLKPSL